MCSVSLRYKKCIVERMNVVAAIILGLVQGLTEFIPVSSSGHIVLVQNILNLPSNFKFDVLLNFGTLLALVLYYRSTITEIIFDVVRRRDVKLALRLVVATLPAVTVGLLFGDFIEKSLQSVWVVITMLIIVGAFMVLFKHRSKGKELSKLTTFDAIKIGLVQAVALIPGTSRSGSTILMGQAVGLGSSEAARFSFMLAIPTIFGATMKVALSGDGRHFIAENLGLILLGNAMSFLAGAFAVRFLIRILGERGLKPFGFYRLGLSALLIVLLFAKII